MVLDLKTGTTTVGVLTPEAVILATDQRVSLGHIAYDDETNKLSKITDFIGVTNAGSVGDTMTIVRYLKSQAKMYEIEREIRISTKALVTLMANILSGNRYYPFEVQFVVGGFTGQPELYEVTPFGAILKRDKFAVSGSGTEPAMTALDLGYSENMSEKEGIKLAIRAISAGKRRDIFSGGRSVNVMVIDQKGIRELDEKTVEKISKEGN
ncbi:MAG: proteasome subunit beta [Candidatus Diapherotrites archaeon]|uniref:proteasome endopeptidase complex n=1 Tax=Candidatus Iainarchaeum sp. TaxID=3101447 RepID=A0A8T4L103_9ARCH|nr:proteasome subunit beta [Candidatus Diapherotrites archaeon]